MSYKAAQWYKNAIIYGIDVEFFQDSNGDGIGDFRGLIQRLDYIAELGANCIWLLPFFPSPGRDNGYDVADYYGVAEQHGTLGDLVEFIRRARERGIRVVIDLVLNHTSDEHPWFRKASADPDSVERNFYIWSNEPAPPLPGKGTIFPGEEDGVWSKDEQSGCWYYHRFYSFEPSLNLADERLQEEVFRILGFWLQCGASGFRVDAASHMIEAKGRPGETRKAGHSILKAIRSFVDENETTAMLLGEADESPAEIAAFFGDADELHASFNFLLCNYFFLALARQDAEPISTGLKLLPEVPHNCQWVNFLRNFDELDLERLSESQRQEVFDAFAPKEEMRIYGRGIRRRMAPMLDGDPAHLRLAYSLLFALPGSPALIAGDEIGMGDDLSIEGRSAVRTPIQWSAQKNASFTTGEPRTPVIDSGKFSFKKVNVEAQEFDPDSLLNWTRKLARTRRHCPEVGMAVPEVIETGDSAILAVAYARPEGVLLTVHNLSSKKRTVPIELPRDPGGRGRIILSSRPEQEGDETRRKAEHDLEGFACRWMLFKTEGALLRQ